VIAAAARNNAEGFNHVLVLRQPGQRWGAESPKSTTSMHVMSEAKEKMQQRSSSLLALYKNGQDL
jgi:hypothetical protein